MRFELKTWADIYFVHDTISKKYVWASSYAIAVSYIEIWNIFIDMKRLSHPITWVNHPREVWKPCEYLKS